MDTPGAYETKATEAFYYVTPVEKDWDAKHQEEHLRLFNPYVVDMINVHEVWPGHYLQFLYAKRFPTKTRKLIFCGTNAEGWAHYTEQMMVDEGFGGGDPKVRLAQLQEALLRDCRYVVGIKLHTQGWTVEQGAKLFVEKGFQEPANGLRGVAPRRVQPDVPLLHARQARDPEAAGRVHEGQGREPRAVPRRVRVAGGPADSAGAEDPVSVSKAARDGAHARHRPAAGSDLSAGADAAGPGAAGEPGDGARRSTRATSVALQAAGSRSSPLAADDDHPDAVFVQDRVAIVGGRAIVGPSAVAERRGEAEAIVAALPKSFPVVTLRAPACLDWGDVLMTEKALFVGLSERSNEAAVRQLREMLAPDWMVEGRAAAARPAAPALRAAPTSEGASCSRSRRWPTSAGRAGFTVVPVPPDELAVRQRPRARPRRDRSRRAIRRRPRASRPPAGACGRFPSASSRSATAA